MERCLSISVRFQSALFDLPFGDLQFSQGFGVSYATPVGPLRLDMGFPFKPPRGDKSWQIHFSIGAYF